MATYQDGNVRRATANTVSAMRRSAERRQCPKCERKSALISFDDGTVACRWGLPENGTKCDYVVLPVYIEDGWVQP